MTDELRTSRAPRARPVADIPIDALLARADELARRWAIALVLDCPLDRLGGLPLEELARAGPALVAQVLRALTADIELERLSDDGAGSGRERSAPAAQLAAIAGARDAAATVTAVEALRGVLWEGLLETFECPAPRQIADAADRLGFVCASALASTLAATSAVPAESAPGYGEGLPESARAAPTALAGATRASAAVIVDEHPGAVAAAQPQAQPAVAAVTALAGELGASARAATVARRAEIEIRDERGDDEGPVAWIGSIGRALDCFAEDGLPFAVLLVELREIESIRRAASATALSAISDQVEDALEAELGRFAPGSVARRAERGLERAPWLGSLTRESPGRYWLLAPKTNRLSARRLAEHLARTVASSSRWREAPLEVVIGSAICPEDGREAAVLAAHADVGLYADRASLGRQGNWVDEPA